MRGCKGNVMENHIGISKGSRIARHVRLRIKKSKHAFGQVARNAVATYIDEQIHAHRGLLTFRTDRCEGEEEVKVRVIVSKGRVYLSRHKASGFQSSVKGRPPGVVA
ncbi:hypothetical protein ANTRET_LOCUS7213 [Anthophora retusa]